MAGRTHLKPDAGNHKVTNQTKMINILPEFYPHDTDEEIVAKMENAILGYIRNAMREREFVEAMGRTLLTMEKKMKDNLQLNLSQTVCDSLNKKIDACTVKERCDALEVRANSLCRMKEMRRRLGVEDSAKLYQYTSTDDSSNSYRTLIGFIVFAVVVFILYFILSRIFRSKKT